ncbi:mobilization protein [Mucilaginibacter sp. PPCGB 2223]|uniref:mobilization protein n=1 Tax=Mucilaginibacter sp. PPCGB 2223 TaxID=1886027 RepID=UPI000826B99D|nr:mobilization protein [Mucilaginibacter sp. PPCGB 2223]OCX52795.1 mobilization protein [Mucilaginibacter sp. PPCGB 2223]
MSRKKAIDQDTLLDYPVRTRVTTDTGKRLEKIKMESGCQSISEVARIILSDQPIKCFYMDVSMNAPMEQMALIRKELKAIGININQQTRYFNSSKSDAQRSFYAIKTADLYRQVGSKVDELLSIVNQLAVKWLQGS